MKRYRIVTADRDAGKTTFIKKLISEDDCAAGFISEKNNDEYYLFNIKEKTSELLLSEKTVLSGRYRRWYINEKAFEESFSYIESFDRIDEVHLYIDEVGLMECEGRGFAHILTYASEKGFDMTIAIRTAFISEVIRHFPFLSDAEILEVPSWH